MVIGSGTTKCVSESPIKLMIRPLEMIDPIHSYIRSMTVTV